MRVLLLSPYDAHSHRRWREGLVAAFPDRDWTVLTLPPRHFNWRIRGNSLSWAFGERAVLDQPHDLLITTSMTDLSALKGMVPALASVPSLVYCHENQFAYPGGRHEPSRIEPKMVNLYTVLSADRVAFNSGYNRQSFLQGVGALLQKLPDAVPPAIADHIAEKSCVIPVPLEAHWFGGRGSSADRRGPITIVWNHRWEYDKAPERMFNALVKLRAAGVDFRVHVIGQQFREQPPVFAEMYRVLGAQIGAWGMAEDVGEYRRLLQQSQVVLSTALHEFQGLAVLEAVASGCIPLVPDRLAYPEYFASEFRYPSLPDDPEQESAGIARRLLSLEKDFRNGTQPPVPDVSHLSWPRLKRDYALELAGLAEPAGLNG